MSVPRKSSATRSMPLSTRVAARRNSGRWSLAPFIALLPTTMSASRVAQVLERAAVEVEIAEVDLLADHPGAARLEDAAAQRLAVVRLAERERADLGALVRPGARRARRCDRVEPFSARITSNRQLGRVERDAHGVVAVEQLGDRLAQDPFLVVDGDDDRDVAAWTASYHAS